MQQKHLHKTTTKTFKQLQQTATTTTTEYATADIRGQYIEQGYLFKNFPCIQTAITSKIITRWS